MDHDKMVRPFKARNWKTPLPRLRVYVAFHDGRQPLDIPCRSRPQAKIVAQALVDWAANQTGVKCCGIFDEHGNAQAGPWCWNMGLHIEEE